MPAGAAQPVQLGRSLSGLEAEPGDHTEPIVTRALGVLESTLSGSPNAMPHHGSTYPGFALESSPGTKSRSGGRANVTWTLVTGSCHAAQQPDSTLTLRMVCRRSR